MSPEFGATATMFPIDDETISYLRLTGRSAERVALVERYAKEQGLWREPGDGPTFDELLDARPRLRGAVAGRSTPPAGSGAARDRCARTSGLELPGWPRGARARPRSRSTAMPSPPRRPSPSRRPTRRRSRRSADRWRRRPPAAPVAADAAPADQRRYPSVEVSVDGQNVAIQTGSVAIAAITSCTNTSNPTVMVGAGLLARNAIARGLRVAPTVKTSLAPGSRAVTGYLEAAGLMEPLARARVRAGGLRLHDLHRQLRAARRAGRRGDRGRTTWWWRPCCRATATSRVASIRSRARAISPRRRSSSRSRSPAASTST